MLDLQCRIDLLVKLGDYLRQNDEAWQSVVTQAGIRNPWFTKAFTDLAANAIADRFLQRPILEQWVKQYPVPAEQPSPKKVGIVMAGNIPLVGFHDWLCVFISGHIAHIKLSSKDTVLLPHLLDVLAQWEPTVKTHFRVAEQLKGCDAYIATGSDNSARYFEYYFGKYPSIIRKNRTSVAILNGQESTTELASLADDICLYFGLGCRNVTALRVPIGYDFQPLLDAGRKYGYFFDHSRYKNNYDYQLAVALLNNRFYMTNNSILLIEQEALFSPISQVNYAFYQPGESPQAALEGNNSVQCVVGQGGVPFGKAQEPAINDYADGVDTMAFLAYL